MVNTLYLKLMDFACNGILIILANCQMQKKKKTSSMKQIILSLRTQLFFITTGHFISVLVAP